MDHAGIVSILQSSCHSDGVLFHARHCTLPSIEFLGTQIKLLRRQILQSRFCWLDWCRRLHLMATCNLCRIAPQRSVRTLCESGEMFRNWPCCLPNGHCFFFAFTFGVLFRRADPQDNPLRRRPRRLFRRRRKPQPKAYPEEEEDEPSQDFQPDGYEYREYDPEDAPPPPEEEGALVPFSYGSPRDFVIDEGDEEEEEEEDKPRYRDNGHEQQAAPYSDNEPVVDPYDQDPFVNAGDYDNDHNARAVPEQDTDPRVYAGRDPDFAPGDKVYGSDDPNAVPGDRVFGADDPNALPGDRVYGGDDPFAVPREAVYGSDDPNALPGEKVYGSDDPRPVPGDRVFGSNDPNHVPHETVYGSDDPNHLPGERVYGRDDPNHLPRETVYGSDDPNASADAAPDLLSGEGVLVPVPPSNPFASFAAPPAAEKGHVERENPATPETAAPDLLSGQSVLVPVTPSNPFASLGALDGDGENDDDDDDDDDDDELNQANLYSNNVLKAPYVRPTSTAPDEAPRSRPSSRASSRASNQYDSGSRPSSRASNRERATPVTVGEWGLSFD